MLEEITLINYKKHRNFTLKPDGQSFFVVGDLEEGKTTLIDAIRATLLQVPMSDNPLSEGAESGSLTAKWNWGDGHTYTVGRRFNKNGLMRFEVVDENGGNHSLKPLIERLFGKAFINNFFDFKEYFYQATTTAQRTQYFVKCIGGDQVLDNTRKIKVRIAERNQIGGEKNTYQTLVMNSTLDPETLETDIVKYELPKRPEQIREHEPLRLLVEQLKDKDILQEQFNAVAQQNEDFIVKDRRNAIIDAEIVELQKAIAKLKAEKKHNQKWLKDFPADMELEKQLADDLSKVDLHNDTLMPQIEEQREIAMAEIEEFNAARIRFHEAIKYYNKYIELSTKWEDIENNIDSLRAENKEIFIERLPIPEITYDEENEVIMYQGSDGISRELCFPNVSTGRAIGITAQIQRILNPKGNNLIVIPDGANAGSGLDEIVAECNNFGMQYIVEVTERKRKLKVMFEEEYMGDINEGEENVSVDHVEPIVREQKPRKPRKSTK